MATIVDEKLHDEIDYDKDDGKMKWFGPKWNAPATRDSLEVPVPVDRTCTYCGEGFVLTDKGFILGCGNAFHKNCLVRSVVGSVGHLRAECSCYNDGCSGGDAGDPPGLTKREAADKAAELFYLQQQVSELFRNVFFVEQYQED